MTENFRMKNSRTFSRQSGSLLAKYSKQSTKTLRVEKNEKYVKTYIRSIQYVAHFGTVGPFSRKCMQNLDKHIQARWREIWP
jgi:SLT domain-containing protein